LSSKKLASCILLLVTHGVAFNPQRILDLWL
jgi:hypothetical protein